MWTKYLIAIFIGAFFQGTEPEYQSNQSQEKDEIGDWLEHIRKCASSTKSLRADFVQERTHPLLTKTSQMNGIFEARRGLQFRLAYAEPEGKLLVSNGAHLWAYDSLDKTAVKSNLNDSILSKLLSFFTEAQDSTLFVPKYLGGDLSEEGRRVAIELIPKKADRFIESIILTVTESCPAVTRVIAVENTGAVVRVSLNNVEANPSISSRKFNFVPPRGTSIVVP